MAGKKKHRYEYLNEFKVNDTGGYEFKGSHYIMEAQGNQWKMWLFLVGCVGTVVMAGFVPCGGMYNSFYVILPYAIEVCLAAYAVYVNARIALAKGKMRDYVYEKTVPRVNPLFTILDICALMSACGEIIHLLATSFAQATMSGVFIALQCAAVVCAGGYLTSFRSIKWNRLCK